MVMYNMGLQLLVHSLFGGEIPFYKRLLGQSNVHIHFTSKALPITMSVSMSTRRTTLAVGRISCIDSGDIRRTPCPCFGVPLRGPTTAIVDAELFLVPHLVICT